MDRESLALRAGELLGSGESEEGLSGENHECKQVEMQGSLVIID